MPRFYHLYRAFSNATDRLSPSWQNLITWISQSSSLKLNFLKVNKNGKHCSFSIMTDPRRGPAKLGGRQLHFLGDMETSSLESLKDWSGNEKHEIKVDYWDLIRPDISMPNPHIYSIMVISFWIQTTKTRPSNLQDSRERGRVKGGGNISIIKIRAITNNLNKTSGKTNSNFSFSRNSL